MSLSENCYNSITKSNRRAKPQMALDMMKSAYSDDMPFFWCAADSVYGDYRGIGTWLESLSKGYVLAVLGKAYVWSGFTQHNVGTILKALPETGWEHLRAGIGTKGERYYDWLLLSLNNPPIKGWKKSLLVRRSIAKPEELRAFICFYPDYTPTGKLAEIAGIRWTVEALRKSLLRPP